MSKAFDMVEWSELFMSLLRRKVSFCVMRIMLYIYENQRCHVKWAAEFSDLFSVSNGVRQGAVSSTILFAVYIDDLLSLLKGSRLGCHIDNVFVGAFVFADDILLFAASRAGLQSLVDICYKFAAEKNLKFGTNPDPLKSKTKCIVFAKKYKSKNRLAPILLDGLELPWVSKITHLGCILDADNSMKTDILSKRGQFVGKVNSLFQEFHSVSSDTLLKLIWTYATSFYGLPLWDLHSKECERLYKSWNVTVRNVLKLHRQTHRHLIEPLSGHPHLKSVLLGRYIGFHESLVNSPKFTVRYLARLFENDLRTVLGRTLRTLVMDFGVSDARKLSSKLVKKGFKYAAVPPGSEWKDGLALELISGRDLGLELLDFTRTEIDEMLTFVCTS